LHPPGSLHCEPAHGERGRVPLVLHLMERMLLLWDEFDDWFGAGRHVVVTAMAGPLSWLRRR